MVTSVRGAKSLHGLRTGSIRGAKSGHGVRVSSIRGAKSGHGRMQSVRGAKSDHGLRVRSVRVAQSQQFTQHFTSYFVSQNPAAEFPPCLITCILDDNPALVLPVISGNISMSRSQPSTWTITLDNDDGSCNLNATSGPFVGKFTCDPFDGSNAIRNFVRVKMNIGGQVWNSPKLLIQDAQESENATTHIVVISGADASEILFLKDQFMADVAATTAVRQSNDVALEILSEYNLAARLDQKNYPVSLLHRIGQPIEWLRLLFEVRQAWWTMEGDTFVARSGGYSSTGKDWVLTDNQHLKFLNRRYNARPEVNEVTIQRVDTNSGKAVEPREDEGLGFVRKNLDFPVDRATANVSVQDGYAASFCWFGSAGLCVQTGPRYTGGSGPVVALQFSVQPNELLSNGGPLPIGFLATPKKYKWWVDARAQVTEPFPGPSNYTVTVQDGPNIAATWLRRHSEPIVNELIPDEVTAQEYGRLWLQETLRFYETANIETLANPFIRLGDMVWLNAVRQNLVDHKMLVDGHKLEWDARSAVSQLELSRPRVGF